MLFNNLTYAIFIPVVFILYRIVPIRYRWALLLAVSYWFCAQLDIRFLLVLFIQSLFAYVFGILIDTAKTERARRRFAAGAAAELLGGLVLFKYLGFFAENLNALLYHLTPHGENFLQIPVPQLFVPIGISFYTLQVLGYILDVSRGKYRAEWHFGRFLLFASFFPQLISGPIGRGDKLLPQYRRLRKPNGRQISMGLKRMAWGYFKKLAIADVLAVTVNKIFGAPDIYIGLIFPASVLMYTIELYCDFSGYSDIAVGTAQLFGVDLDQNFNTPYLSQNVREFWNRWHISLSGWFRDYLYIPLGGSHYGIPKRVRNTLIVMLISGLWHGASWTFLFWGLLHGLYQSADVLITRTHGPKKINEDYPKPVRILRTILTFSLISFAWLFFRADSMKTALTFMKGTFTGIEDPVQYLKTFVICLDMPYMQMVWISIPIVILIIADFVSFTKKKEIVELVSAGRPAVRYTIYVLLLVGILLFSQKGVTAEFIYSGF